MPVITDVERIWVDLPLKEVPQRNMVREIPHWTLFELCRVTLDTGHTGFGETMVYYTWGTVSQQAVDRAIGRNPAEIIWDDTLGAGLQMACFDVVGKMLGAPVWSLLGRKVRERAIVGWWAIDMPGEDWVLECKDAMAAGYTTFKTKARPWFDLEQQVDTLLQTVPEWFQIDLDFNDFGLDPSVAKALCKRLETWPNIAIWESPIRQEDVPGNRHLREHLAVPIAQHAGRPNMAIQIQQEMCDGFVIEGGATKAMRHAAVCQELNRPFWLQWVGTNLTATFCLHVQAAMAQARWPAIHCNHMYAAQPVHEPYVVRNGMAEVPNEPGIGVSIDWGVIEKYRIEPIEKPYPFPGLLLRLDWPSGAKSYFSHAQQLWDEFGQGLLPAFVPGVHLNRVMDDGTPAWRELYEKARAKPVHG